MFSGISLFDSLTPSEKQSLSLFCQERFLPADEVLFHEWDEATAMYIVKEGTLQAIQHRSDGIRVLWNIGTGELVWELALFDEGNITKTRTASVIAVEPSVLLVIMNYSIADLAKKHNEIYEKIKEIVRQRRAQNMR